MCEDQLRTLLKCMHTVQGALVDICASSNYIIVLCAISLHKINVTVLNLPHFEAHSDHAVML